MDYQLVGVKANRLKDNNDLEEWKTEKQKFESGSPASECAVGECEGNRYISSSICAGTGCCSWLSLSQDLNKTTFRML